MRPRPGVGTISGFNNVTRFNNTPHSPTSAPGNTFGYTPGGYTPDGYTPGRPPGGFVFGRLVSIASNPAKTPTTLQVVPLIWGSQPVTLPLPAWAAVVSVLMRKL